MFSVLINISIFSSSFIFTRTLLNKVFILFHYILWFFRQLHNFIFPKFIFLSKKLFLEPFTVFQGIEIFSIKRTEIHRNLQVQCIVNTVDESELPSQPITVFAWSSKNMQSCIILVEDYVFSVDKFWMFFVKCCF